MAGIEGLLAGHTLADRYRIDEVIGRGGFAAVYRARDERLERTVAVKVVMVAAPDEASRARIRARFHREAQVAAQLQHPNVVTIFDFGTDEKLGLLRHGLELDGRRLRPAEVEVISEQRLTPNTSLRCLSSPVRWPVRAAQVAKHRTVTNTTRKRDS